MTSCRSSTRRLNGSTSAWLRKGRARNDRGRCAARSGRCTGRRTDPLPVAGTRIEDRADRAARFLEAAAAGLNLLVAGGTQVGNPIRCEDTR